MKKFLIILAVLSLQGCSLDELSASFFDAKKETVEAVQNLQNEALSVKHTVEVKTEQVKQAADSVSKAADSISKASEDLKAVTSEVK